MSESDVADQNNSGDDPGDMTDPQNYGSLSIEDPDGTEEDADVEGDPTKPDTQDSDRPADQ